MSPNSDRNQRASRRLALELGCVSPGEFSPQFWAHPANVSRVLRCLRALPARALSDAARRMERLGLFFHGLAMETGEGGVRGLRISDPYIGIADTF